MGNLCPLPLSNPPNVYSDKPHDIITFWSYLLLVPVSRQEPLMTGAWCWTPLQSLHIKTLFEACLTPKKGSCLASPCTVGGILFSQQL